MNAPAYQRLANDLRDAIERGDYTPGDTLPKLVDLAASYGISKQTASEAFRALEREGLVEVGRRRGTVVRDRAIPQPVIRTGEVLRDELGYYFDPVAQPWKALRAPTIGWGRAPGDIAHLLAIPASEDVLIRDRVMGDPTTGEVTQLATSYLPAAIARGTRLESADTGPGGIYDRLEEMGHRPLRWERIISARMPTPHEAEILNVPRGVPLLRIVRTTTSPDSTLLEINDTRMSAAHFAIGQPLHRHPSAQLDTTPTK